MFFFDLDIIEVYLNVFKESVRIDEILIMNYSIFDVRHRRGKFVNEHVGKNVGWYLNSYFMQATNGYLGASDEALNVSRIEGKVL